MSRRERYCRLVSGLAAFLALFFLVGEIRLIQIPAQRDYGEGHNLWMTRQILEKPYPPIDTLPFVVFPYTPLYHLTSRLAGVFVSDLLIAGRSLSLISTLGIALAVVLTILFSLPSRAPLAWRVVSASFGGAMVLMADSVVGWASLMRVDMLALLLMYSGLGVYIVLGRRERWLYLAGALFVLAVFTKQTMVSAPLACVVFGLLTDRWRTLRLCAFMVALGLAGVWYFNGITHGGFLKHVVQYNIHPYFWRIACTRVYNHARAALPAVTIAVLAVAGVFNVTAVRRRGVLGYLQTRLAHPYDRAILISGLNCALAGAWMLSIGKMGSDYNFFLTWDISLCLLCGLFVFRLAAAWTEQGLVPALLLSTMLLPGVALLGAYLPGSGYGQIVKEDAEVVRMLKESPGPVYSDEILLVLQAGKPLEVEAGTIAALTLAGGWDERAYVKLMEQGYFSLLVTRSIYAWDMFTPAVSAAIEKAYVLDRRIGPYFIYRPARDTSRNKP